MRSTRPASGSPLDITYLDIHDGGWHVASHHKLMPVVASVADAMQYEGPPLQVLLAFASNEALKDSRTYEFRVPEGCKPLRPVSDPSARRLEPYQPAPMLIIGQDDLMECLDEASAAAFPELKWYLKPNGIRDQLIVSEADPRYRFWDSSIWHRYVSVVPQQTFRERLSTAFEDLCTYARQGLYHTIVAQEFLEYQCRKLQHAYYLDLPEGHSKRVTPERFHAESWMRQEADLLSGLLEGYQWGAIIIDDYFQQPLRTSSRDDSSASPVRTVNKSELIESLLRWKSGSQLRLLNRNDSPPMRGYVSFAADQIRQYNHADVILLDYYFNDADSQNPQEQYANKLIRKLISSRNRFERLNWKPHDKFWIFPISVFDRALQSHLKVYGEGQVSEHIELSEGADPVNTPELFRCLLLRFLHAQRMQVGVSLEELFKYLAPANRDEEPHKFRFHLRRNYFRIIEKVAPYFAYNLSPRKKNSAPRNQISHADKSLLIRSVLDKTKHQREFVALLMRLQHLIYLVAFGPAWEWRKIQQELLHVETLLQLLLPAEQAAASAGKDWSIFVGMVRAYYQAMKKD